jgi:hypothetical protein
MMLESRGKIRSQDSYCLWASEDQLPQVTKRHEFRVMASHGALQTKLFTPSNVSTMSSKLAVFTHPWAPLGGNMHDP